MNISFREKRRICLNLADARFPRNPAPLFKIRNERKIQMIFHLRHGHIVHNFPTFMTYALGIERGREKRVYTESGGERKSPYDSSFLSFRGSGGGGERERKEEEREQFQSRSRREKIVCSAIRVFIISSIGYIYTTYLYTEAEARQYFLIFVGVRLEKEGIFRTWRY